LAGHLRYLAELQGESMTDNTNPVDLNSDQSSVAEDHEHTGDTQGKKDKKTKKANKELDKLVELETEIAELKDKYMRLYAEFDNYKKRTVKEKLELMRTAAQDTLTSLLPLMDDFDRAKRISDDPATTENFTDGVELVYLKLYTTMKQLGVHEMESTGAEFNPELHEAITEIPAPSEELKGKIVDTVEKGYYLHDKIIRHAKVVVGR
jgi:molecular chaperone GrpE